MYQPTFESVNQHPLPGWYQDAKFGIFIHWTISSVPAYAPTGLGDIGQLFARKSQRFAYAHQPYAEWYQNSLRIRGSPAYQYHRQTFGARYPYQDFAARFNQESRQWDPEAWAELFHQAGARYAVLVAKHHDGFLLWNSRFPNPRLSGYSTSRDVVGELTRSISDRGLKMGLYYSSPLDWTFTQRPVMDFADLFSTGPTSRQYLRYAVNHWKELIERYEPWVLWSDIGFPPHYNLAELFATFYNHNPEGVVNDRWFQLPGIFLNPIGKIALKLFAKRIMHSGGTTLPRVPHCDFRTAEYQNLETQMPYKWESVRGIGNSFAYNQFEQPGDYMQAPDLIRMLADVVSKNGNLLLNVGPRPDGSIPLPQVEALQGIGRWLAVNGEAIYATRPWRRAGDEGENGVKVRYTAKGGVLYILILRLPKGSLRLEGIPARAGSTLRLLGGQSLEWQREGDEVIIHLPEGLDEEFNPGAAHGIIRRIGEEMTLFETVYGKEGLVKPVRVEHLREPLGIGTARPRLSWAVETEAAGWVQTAYAIEACAPDGQVIAQTGRVNSADSLLVDWPFDPLTSRQQVSVRVRAWGAGGEAAAWSSLTPLEAGLLQPSDWQARFIRPDMDFKDDAGPAGAFAAA